jgi:type IV secretion system protein VirB4
MDIGKPQNSVYGPYKFLDNHAYVAKAGELVLFAEMQGIDGECSTDEEMESQHSRLLTALVSLPEEIRVFTYLVKLEGATITPTEHVNPVVKQTAERRAAFLEAKDRAKPLSTMRLYLALVYEPPRALGINMDSSVLKLSRKKLNAGRRAIYSGLRLLEETVNDLLGLRLLEKAEVFEYLRFLASLDPEVAKAEPLQYDNNLDVHLAANMLTIEPTGIRNHTTKPEVLTLRKLPKRSSAGMMRKVLSAPGNLIVCCQWKREPNDKALKRLRSAESHWNLVKILKNWQAALQVVFQQGSTEGVEPDQAALKKVTEVNAAICALSDKVHAWQNFTAITWGKESGAAATQLMSIVGNHQGSLMRETSYACGPYISLIPGTTPKHKDKFRKRARQWELGQCIDMGMFYNHSRGHAINPVTKKKALLQLVSNDNTLIDFNLIPPKAKRTGVVIVGEPGSGKSTFMQLCIDSSMKDDPYTLILDGVGSSYRLLTEKHSGVYLDLDPEGVNWEFTINPFDCANTKKNREYLTSLTETCMSTGGYKAEARKTRNVYEQVSRVLARGDGQISDLELSEELMHYLWPWVGDGPYAFVFDNKRDTLRLSRFTTVDFSRLGEIPKVVGPLQFHLFRCWDQVVYDESLLTTPKNMFADEGWDLIRLPRPRRYIKKAGRTWRKRLGGLILGTQSIVELKSSGILKLIRELCPMAILLSNPNGEHKDYAEVFQLNEEEKRLYSRLNEPGSGLIKSAGFSKIFHTPLDPEALWTYSNDPLGNDERNRMIRKHDGNVQAALAELAAAV